MQLTTILKDQQEDFISPFWIMLQECEEKAIENNDVVLKHCVNHWYNQWNKVTQDNKKPYWNK